MPRCNDRRRELALALKTGPLKAQIPRAQPPREVAGDDAKRAREVGFESDEAAPAARLEQVAAADPGSGALVLPRETPTGAEFGDVPLRDWQIGLRNPIATADCERSTIDGIDATYRRIPLRPRFDLAKNGADAFGRRIDGYHVAKLHVLAIRL